MSLQVQSGKAVLADAVEQWCILSENLDEEDKDSNYFQLKLKEALLPEALAANILHPKYKGKRILS